MLLYIHKKTSSMIALLIGQIIFRVRHPEQAYSMRTNYTVKSNRESGMNWLEKIGYKRRHH